MLGHRDASLAGDALQSVEWIADRGGSQAAPLRKTVKARAASSARPVRRIRLRCTGGRLVAMRVGATQLADSYSLTPMRETVDDERAARPHPNPPDRKSNSPPSHRHPRKLLLRRLHRRVGDGAVPLVRKRPAIPS
jgi:hypothetical protein